MSIQTDAREKYGDSHSAPLRVCPNCFLIDEHLSQHGSHCLECGARDEDGFPRVCSREARVMILMELRLWCANPIAEAALNIVADEWEWKK